MKTAACERIGIDIPIVQAPMAGAVGPRLAAAVGNAGGLGTLAPSDHLEPDQRRRSRLAFPGSCHRDGKGAIAELSG